MNSFAPASAAGYAPVDSLTTASHSANVLVIDDQAANLEAVQGLLRQHGFEVTMATSGREGLERCELRLPDLILLDMRMPEMDGFTVCERLKANPVTAAIPVIFLTADRERQSVVRGFSVGAVDYVTKPFVAEELLARVRTHVTLKRMHDDLLQLAKERADLTQVVAHDLKNPLTVIMLAVDRLDPARVEDFPESVDAIKGSTRRCLELIDEYLGRWALSEKVEAPEIESCRISGTLEAAVSDMKAKAAERGMRIALSIDDDAEILSNRLALRQIVDNLVSNAIKYADAETTIEVATAIGRSGMLRLTVADRGAGIPEDRRQLLFKRYQQLGDVKAAHSSGLGLAVAKDLAARMGAHLWYEPRDGGGSIFSLALPLAGDES